MSNNELSEAICITESTFDWLTIPSLVNFTNKEVTENQLRWWLRSKKSNGLGKYTRTIGRKIYIHKLGFMKWFESGEDGS